MHDRCADPQLEKALLESAPTPSILAAASMRAVTAPMSASASRSRASITDRRARAPGCGEEGLALNR